MEPPSAFFVIVFLQWYFLVLGIFIVLTRYNFQVLGNVIVLTQYNN